MTPRNFKLEVNGTREKIDFGPRNPGDVGRDILAVKYALGVIDNYSSYVDDDIPSLDDPNGWFDCVSGTPVSNLQAATFDSNLQTYLTRFQLDNQFYILCYLFTKFAIPKNTARVNALNRTEAYSSEQSQQSILEEYQSNQTVSSWVSSGAGRLNLPGGLNSIDLSSLTTYNQTDRERQASRRAEERYNTNPTLSQQLDLIVRMFDFEFGRLGEATLAVMHGWLPRVSLYNEGYQYDPRIFEGEDRAYDVVLLGLYASFLSGDLAQDYQISANTEDGLIFEPTTFPESSYNSVFKSYTGIDGGSQFQRMISGYKRQVAVEEEVLFSAEEGIESIGFKEQDFGTLSYDISKRKRSTTGNPADGFQSMIYRAVEWVSENFPRPSEVNALSNRDYSEALTRLSEPDPLTDPDPFEINSQVIGYFHVTDYTLENLPPLLPSGDVEPTESELEEYNSQIRALEETALTEILRFYGKPEIFYLDTRDPEFQVNFIGDMTPYFTEVSDSGTTQIHTPSHNGDFLSAPYRDAQDKIWVVTTQDTYDAVTSDPSNTRVSNSLEVYSSAFERNDRGILHFDGVMEPLIQFVEFITPSLRPGDSYRAKFYINRAKLNYITNGYEDPQEIIRQLTSASEAQSTTGEYIPSAHCEDNLESPFGTSLEDSQRRYEEYKALASRRKREIARALRESTLEAYQNQAGVNDIDVDLGVFGNANLNFTGMVADSYDYTTDVLGAFGDLIQGRNDAAIALGIDNAGFSESNPAFEKLSENPLTITFPVLEERIKVAAENLRNAYKAATEERISFPGENFNGAQEAAMLSNLPAELRKLITQYKVNKSKPFNFSDGTGDSDRVAGLGGFDAVTNFIGIGGDNIVIKFESASKGKKQGLKIVAMTAAGDSIADLESNVEQFPSLSNPRTVGYLAQIYDMTGGRPITDDPRGIVRQLVDNVNPLKFFESESGFCREIGVGKKGLGYLRKYTFGLKGETEEYEPIKQWYEENVEDPFKDWYKKSSKNWDNILEGEFNEDEFMGLLGKTCTLDKLYKEFLNKISLSGFLCQFLRCIKLPGLNIQIPNLRIPPIPPKIEIFGWYKKLVQTLINQFFKILTQILCTFVRMIIDFLNFPFCQEQLRDQLYGAHTSTSPIIQQALVDGITDLGISPENMETAKDFADEALTFLTGQEICRLLNGERIDPVSMAMLERLANRNSLSELNSDLAIINFFETIGLIMPPEFCDGLEDSTFVLDSINCEDSTSYVDQIRRKMLAGGATDEEIDRATELAQKNLRDQAEKLQAFGETGIQGLLPDVVNFGDPNALLNDLPSNFKEQANQTAKGLFDSAKMGFLSSLSNYGPSLFLNVPKFPQPGDPDYNQDSIITVASILENLRNYSTFVDSLPAGVSQTPANLIKQLNLLHQVYETTDYRGSKVLTTYHRESPDKNIIDHISQLFEDRPEGFRKVSFNQAADKNPDDIFLKPVGYSQYSFYNVDDEESENPQPHNVLGHSFGPAGIQYERDDFILNTSPKMRTLDKAENENNPKSNLQGFSFQNSYLIEREASSSGTINGGTENTVLLKAISDRLQFLQSTLQYHLAGVTQVVPGTEYLGTIKQLFDQSQETALENQRLENEEIKELIDITEAADSGISVLLQLAAGGMGSSVKYQEFSTTVYNTDTLGVSQGSPELDPYSVTIFNDNMFRTGPREEDGITIQVCDKIPGPDNEEDGQGPNNIYRNEISDLNIQPGAYTRREMFAKKVAKSLQMISRKYYSNPPGNSEAARQLENLNPLGNSQILSSLKSKHYSRTIEGVLEQIFFSLRNSRIYDEEGYYPGLSKRVSGETYFDDSGNSPCYRNRFNVSQLGVLSFEKIVTDELAEQIRIELAKPENSPFNIDYDDAGPVEKAIQNVCLIGFIRICLVELLLKGALAYSVWDFEGVFDEPIMENFIFEYVRSELNRKEAMRLNWKPMVVRITSIQNETIALRKLVKNQSMKMLDLSKKVYKNAQPVTGDEYYNWYSKYFIPQSHCSKKISIREGQGTLFERNVDLEGNLGQENEAGRGGAAFINWQHPLFDETNIIIDQQTKQTSLGEDNDDRLKETVSNIGAGNNPFFHIEHLLEVTGPLASIESMVLPVNRLTRQVINIDTTDPDAGPVTTRVNGVEPWGAFGAEIARRFPAHLNIADARQRFTTFKNVFDNLESYGLIARPQQQEGARGSAIESVEELNENGTVDNEKYAASTEVFHVDDFIQAIEFSVQGDKSNKLVNHVRGLMDKEIPGDNAEYSIRDTKFDAAVGYPETIRKTPIRFITKTRKFVKFNKDFVSHNFNDFVDGIDVEGYRRKLHSVNGPRSYLGESFSQEARNKYEELRNHVERSKPSEEEFYIVPSNGEILLDFYESLPEEIKARTDIQESIFDTGVEESLEYVESEGSIYDRNNPLKLLADQIELSQAGSFSEITYSAKHEDDVENVHDVPKIIATSEVRGRSYSGVSCKTEYFKDYSEDFNQREDVIDYVYNTSDISNSAAKKKRVFENKIGRFENVDDYQAAKALLVGDLDIFEEQEQVRPGIDAIEEHWVETVYEFSGDSSILAGLYGSFSIGETMDPAVLHFVPEEETINKFNGKLKELIEKYSGQELWNSDRFKNNLGYVYGGGTFWCDTTSRDLFTNAQRPAGQVMPFISRPMGIDKQTNLKMTMPLLTRVADTGDSYLSLFRPYKGTELGFSDVMRRSDLDQDLWPDTQAGRTAESYRPYCKIIHENPEVSNGRRPSHKNTSLLPPNVYKIPLRVVVTQVYVGGVCTQAYCKIIPPKYLRNMKRSDLGSPTPSPRTIPSTMAVNMRTLNASIRKIIDDYEEFIDQLNIRADFSIRGNNKRQRIVTRYFNGREEEYPEFTRDFSNYDLSENRNFERSAIGMSTPHQFCSIERIYTEAFSREVEFDRWNSKSELDQELKTSRGHLLTKKAANLNNGALASLSEIERVRYLESLNFFYDLPRLETIYSNPSTNNFHRIIFSLHNVLQWYLRYRKEDSLWGLLTPYDSEDTSPVVRGVPTAQKHPLVMAAKSDDPDRPHSSDFPAPWAVACNTKILNKAWQEPSKRRKVYSPDSSGYPAKPGVEGQEYSGIELMYYRPGVMTLMHDFVYESNGNSKIDDYTPRGLQDRFSFSNIQSLSLTQDNGTRLGANHLVRENQNLTTAVAKPDARGDYYVNYNRVPGFTIRGNGSPLFVSDGRVSMDDITMMFRASINSIFDKSVSATGLLQRFDSISKRLFRTAENTINDGATGTINNYRVLYDLVRDKESDEASFVATQIISQANQNDTGFQAYVRGIRSDLNISEAVDDIADMMETVIGHYIERCGSQTNFQVANENVFEESLFSENYQILKQLEFMRRFVAVAKRQETPEVKLILLYVVSKYDFAKKVLELFGPEGTLSRERDAIESEWAKICLYYFHIFIAPLHHPTKYEGYHHPSIYNRNTETYSKGEFIGVLELGEVLGHHNNYYPSDQAADNAQDNFRKLINLVTEPYSTDTIVGLGLQSNRSKPRPFWRLLRKNWNARAGESNKFESRLYPYADGGGLPVTIENMEAFLPGGRFNTYTRLTATPSGVVYDNNGRPRYSNIPLQTYSMSVKEIISAVESYQKHLLAQPYDGSRYEQDYLGQLYGIQGNRQNATDAEVTESIYLALEGLLTVQKRREFGQPDLRNVRLNEPVDSEISFLRPHARDALGLGADILGDFPAQGTRVFRKYEQYINFIDVSNRQSVNSILSEMDRLDDRNKSAFVTSVYATPSDAEGVQGYSNNGRLEDLLQKIDISTYYELETNKLFRDYISNRTPGYSVSEVSGLREGDVSNRLAERRSEYKRNLYRNTYLSPMALRAATAGKMRALINRAPDRAGNNNKTPYQFFMDRIRQDWLGAVDTYSGLNDALVRAMFNSVARIGDDIVKGVFEQSTIDQVARLVYNCPNPFQEDGGQIASFVDSEVGKTISGEQRSILMTRDLQMPADQRSVMSSNILSVPVSEYRSAISKYGTGTNDDILIDCFNLSEFKERFMDRTSWMSEELINRNESKMYLKYIFPAKRFQALTTIFSTTTLSTFSTMPTLMETPKTSLAFLMNISSMNSKDRVQMINNMSQAELYKTLADNKASDPLALKCFDLPLTDEFIDQFMTMLVDAIKEFPALLFRGIASVIDPAYKEMKLHWESCDIKNLTWGGVSPGQTWRTGGKGRRLVGGATNIANDPEKGNSKYVPLISSVAADTVYGIGNIFNGKKGIRALRYMSTNLAGYIYKGPVSLLDGAFQFSIPCLGDDDPNLSWPESSTLNFGRYGHPISPLTAIALSMPELKGDKRLRELNGSCTDTGSRQDMEEVGFCEEQDDQEAFGTMPTPEDFEEE